VAIDHEWTTDREGVAAHYLSTSAMGALSEDERLDLRERLIDRLAEVEYRLRLTARVFRTEVP